MPFYPEQEHVNAGREERDRFGSETVEPLALLVHPQQPLSYLERLIQAEIPPLQVEGREKLPQISFRAEADHHDAKEAPDDSDGANVASYSGLGHEGPNKKDAHWVRWSGSTEVGDFIRDAARGREFAVVIQGHDKVLRVAVPSFKDRTHYLRMRLRRRSRQVNEMSQVKRECDMLAHRSAHRLAQGGFAALAAYWVVVYYFSFYTDAGWDVVEPITYLAGLGTIMGGYLWFLYISRDLSYKAAMNVTVSRRQTALYSDRGLDLRKWEALVHEANALRSEIKAVAAEYDVEWDEMRDLGGEEVKEVLEKERNGKKKKKRSKGEDESSEEDEDEEDSGKK